MKQKKKIVLIICCVVLAAAITAAGFYINSLAYKVCRVEAGVEVVASDFLKTPREDAYFAEDSEAFQITVPGEYNVKVKNGWFTHSSVLIIEDTTPPTGQLQDLQLQIGESCTVNDFVVEASDVTALTIAFVQEPDFTQLGRQEVEIAITDLDGNELVLQTELVISPVMEELTWETGSRQPSVNDFLISETDAAFVTDIAAIDMNKTGIYEIEIAAGDISYQSVLKVVDTVAPLLEVQNLSGFTLVPRTIDEFVVSVSDVTEVSISYVNEPDFSLAGTQEIDILVTDEGGNQTTKRAELVLEDDTEPPVLTGVKDISIYIGDTISYRKGVEATDNCAEGLTLEVDNSQVNPNQAGSYSVTYRATDLAGNVTEQVITVTIQKRTHTIEEVNALADKVLAKIITPEMTQLEIVQAIYDYNMSHIGYINYSDKGDWVQAAYEGLAEHKGDCYVYASTAKLLLTRAGITNMDIAKIPAKTSHYWNLVDIGDGWYHFDTTPRKDHPTIFMWTDAQLIEYSNNHYKSHNYDPTLYPEIN